VPLLDRSGIVSQGASIMDVELTRTGKHSLVLHAPVMPAAGTFGFGDRYTRLIKTEKLGAVVTDPITLKARRVARGPNVVPLSGGLLLHTGMPNPGVHRVIKQFSTTWNNLPVPVIAHVMGTLPPDVSRCVRALLDCRAVQGIELGIHDQTTLQEMEALIRAVLDNTQLPLLVRLPLERAAELAPLVAQTDAGALVIGAPPRGLARDPHSGQLVRGRVFGPLVKPLALHAVAQVVALLREDDMPVIGAGGIHDAQDARDFIDVGARAVQLDSVIWVRPQQAEIIARDLGGFQLTRASDAFPDEWFPGIGDTYQSQSVPPPPDDLPE